MGSNLRHETSQLTHWTIQVLKEITCDFSNERKIGQGTYGKVYRGVHENGEEIAVKVLFDRPGLDDEQFQHEFDNVMKLNHQNIVRLVGYCRETELVPMEYEGKMISAERTYRALCFELMHSGSLRKHLSEECDGLDWHTRYKIIKGICEGLKYLHKELENPIYHLDLKPDNILLDKNMMPKLADFGLSRLFAEEQTKMTQSPIGTFGYLPVEYIQHNLISNKLDIFSLGVVMIKIITGPEGRSKSAEMPYEDFIYLVNKNWRNRLQATWSASTLEAYCQQVNVCIKTALRCIENDRHDRPSIEDIIHTLNETETMTDELQNDVQSPTDKMGFHTKEPTSLTIRVLQEITDNFSEDREVGQGAYGKVYRGVLENGEEIAVKLLHNNMQGIDDEQFEREFENLMKLEHHNIIRLFGYCYQRQPKALQHKGRTVFVETTFRALCFEYMQNGSLQKHLSDEFHGLDWETRYKIIKGTCEGLKYLHEGSKLPIYHLDLKPGNILLNENMMPKLADFALSRLFHQIITRSTVGTLGYAPPEYINQGMISKKFDIFSLGVVMIEIITGPKGPSKSAEMPYQEFLDEVHENWRNRLEATWSSPGPLDLYCEQVIICTEIALSCMEMDRHKRPSIVHIIHKLNETETLIDKSLIWGTKLHTEKLELVDRGAKEATKKFKKSTQPRLEAVQELLKEKELELDQLRSELQSQREAGEKEKEALRQLLDSKTREVEDLENKVKVLNRSYEEMKKSLEDRIEALCD